MRTQIIAEIGWNHLGDIKLAEEMICAASESGADYAKFQTWSVKHLKPGPWDHDGRLELYKKSEITEDHHFKLVDYCKKYKIKFLTSIFNKSHVELLMSLGLKEVKVASMEINNIDLLNKVNESFENIFISTGAADLSEIKTAREVVSKSNLTFFHCVSIYPTPADKINLPRILELKKYSKNVGYSGHYDDIDDPVFALSYNINFIEKHFTIDNSLPGRDNQFSLNPSQMRSLCKFRDNYTKMTKNLGLKYLPEELDVRENYRGRWSL